MAAAAGVRSVTVCVCTHNRADAVAAVLGQLAAVEPPPGIALDVLTVVNASADATDRVVEAFAEQDPGRFRFVHEPQVGLSHARNRALWETTADVVAFLDDDTVPHTGWLDALLEGYALGDDVGCVGGQIQLRFPEGRPPWLTGALDEFFSAKVMSGTAIAECVDLADFPYGGNMSFRREAVLSSGAFDPALGRQGAELLVGEETATCAALRAAGFRVLMHPGAVVDHVIGRDRANLRYVVRRSWGAGRSFARMNGVYPRLGPLRMLVRVAARTVRATLRLASSRDRGSFVASMSVVVTDASVLWHRVTTRPPALT